MSQATKVSIESNFIGGLKTEFTGLNFPENACTDADNCVFDLVGNVTRRRGVDYETNFHTTTANRALSAVSSYKWNNAGGDGSSQIVVRQIGSILYFYLSSAATVANPLSGQSLGTVDITPYIATGSSNNPKGVECQFSDGNGYLFVYHPYCDPFYCTYSAGMVLAKVINLQQRDFTGVPENGVPLNLRTQTLTAEHNYNLQNQGWTNNPLWSAFSTTFVFVVSGDSNRLFSFPTGNVIFTVASGIAGISVGNPVTILGGAVANLQGGTQETGSMSATGLVSSYSGTSLTINITNSSSYECRDSISSFVSENSSIGSSNLINLVSAWHSAESNYPSNSDIWYLYKDSSSVFNPTVTGANVVQPSAPAPQGHFILNTFNQQRTILSGVAGITDIITTARPKTGTWFQGRVWYAGVDAAQAATGDAPYTTWTESIYFSQIITDPTQFGQCYQQNDPTDENFFDILPSDGGVIQIQGAGAIYKLFPVQNGLLVFAANGIHFITGSQGIGFTATDFTITKISAVRSLSSTSFVDVQGLPIFWNEEGIYAVEPNQQGLGLTVSPITVGTILSFYNTIPQDSKKYARGTYDPLNYIIQWVYKSTQESSITDRYQFDRVLNLNTYNKAFYPYTIAAGGPSVNGVIYVSSPGGSNAPDPGIRFLVSAPSGATYVNTFAQESDSDYLDWFSYDSVGVNYNSYFITGYKLHGQALRQWQPEYVYMYSNNQEPTHYKIQGIWNYATSGNSGKYSSVQLINNTTLHFGVVARRHRIRGRGTSLQLKVSSVTGQPFDIIGWAIWENINAGI